MTIGFNACVHLTLWKNALCRVHHLLAHGDWVGGGARSSGPFQGRGALKCAPRTVHRAGCSLRNAPKGASSRQRQAQQLVAVQVEGTQRPYPQHLCGVVSIQFALRIDLAQTATAFPAVIKPTAETGNPLRGGAFVRMVIRACRHMLTLRQAKGVFLSRRGRGVERYCRMRRGRIE